MRYPLIASAESVLAAYAMSQRRATRQTRLWHVFSVAVRVREQRCGLYRVTESKGFFEVKNTTMLKLQENLHFDISILKFIKIIDMACNILPILLSRNPIKKAQNEH